MVDQPSVGAATPVHGGEVLGYGVFGRGSASQFLVFGDGVHLLSSRSAQMIS